MKKQPNFSVKIAGTGSYLPPSIITNSDLEKRLDTTSEWILERAGIEERHCVTPEENASTMGAEAASNALDAAGVSIDDVDLIIGATTTPAKLFPGLACHIQRALGGSVCAAFDVQAACAGFSVAMNIAEQYLRLGTFKRVLIVASEVMSRIVDWTDRATCVLFGDGAGAVVLEKTQELTMLRTEVHTNAEHIDLLYCHNALPDQLPAGEQAFLHMKGKEVFKHAVNKLGDMVTNMLAETELTHADIDWLIPHQANLRIIKAIAKKLDMSMDKVILTIHKQGNTSCASIPLALDEAVRDGRIQRGDLLFMESFGGGFSWGSTLIRY